MVKSVIKVAPDARDAVAASLGIDVTDRESAPVRALDIALAATDGPPERPRGIDVALILHELGVDDDTLTAALLSDPRLRDTLSAAEIREGFGEGIAELVRSVHWLNTFRECEHEQVHTAEQAERLRRMLLAMVRDIRAMLIKLAYRVQRLRILSRERYEPRRCVARETLDIYAPLANRIGIARLKWELEDLAFRYLEPQAYKRLAKALEESRVERETYLGDFVERLRDALRREDVDAQVYGRPKHLYSIWRKMQHKRLGVAELYDLRAVRVIVGEVRDCYAALGVVHTLWQHIPKEFDDYIANPKDNGYRSLHTAVAGPGGKIVEVQIRTREMHDLAERGVAAHWAYKEGSRPDRMIRQSVDSMRSMLESGGGDVRVLEDFRTELFSDRVFVLTPDGEIKDLPRGATPLDFAYSVHTEVGHRCRGAKVNGRIVPLTHRLDSGEQIEILTAKQGRPSRDWLNPNLGYLGTPRARAKVRHWFKGQDRERHVEEGREIAERELQRLGVGHEAMEPAVERFNFHSVDELYAALARGEIGPQQFAGSIRVPGISQEIRSFGTHVPTRPRDSGGITISGVGNLLISLAQCCKPTPGDDVVGYITHGRGVTVHRRDCSNIMHLNVGEAHRLIDVDWGQDRTVYPVDVRILAYDRKGLLGDITAVLSNEQVNLIRADTRTNRQDLDVTMDLTLEIEDTGQLGRIMDKIQQVRNVAEVRRRAG
ncbi:MAG: bifunctional (p)ppGpp synthetase/guanosine-3',5'-bis(diphosphate) 3'-pyrophosphohydrolase [Pseudomonadota bacterium]|nr:bifunctional (p)ppGpp synthetase/guanosine-3',5'-bis(diphosphate) 3'-pyrophosphohydrolase [Pseudomonadota bacterium]